MADGALGSPERPAYLDPFTEIVGFRGLGSQYIIVSLAISRASTLAYQQGKAERQGVDSTPISESDGLNDATQCRYIWTSQRPKIVSGTTWVDQSDEKPIPTLQERSDGGWSTSSKKAVKIGGLPSLPTTVSLSGVVGATGRADLFAPQVRWDDVGATGSNTFSEFQAPGGGSFVRTGTVTIRIIGAARVAANLGFIPEGGFVTHSGVYPVVQQPLTISVGSITVTEGKRQWKGFAACKVPGSRPPESALLPEGPGAMMILCAGKGNKKAFPPAFG